MRYKTNNLWKRIIAAVLLLATLAGTTTLMGNKVQAACSHSSYKTITVISQSSCARTGTAYCKCNSCGQTFYKTLPKSSSHGKVTSSIVVQASCTTSGTRYCKCSVCGASWHETIPATGHKPYVKEVNGYARLHCAVCEKRFYADSFPNGVENFAMYLYKKSYSSLTKDQKTNARVNWISYTLSMPKSDAKKLDKEYKGDVQIKVNNVDKLINFIGNCNSVAKLYGFSEAGAVANILGKASFVTCLLNPSKTTGDKVVAAVSLISPTSGQILNSYKTICQAMIALALADAWDKMATEFGIHCDDYGITFEPGDKKLSAPKKTPTYAELFTADKSGRTNLDRFVGYLLNDSSQGFKYLCEHQNANKVYYSYVILWLVRPALDKELSACTDYSSTKSLMQAAK